MEKKQDYKRELKGPEQFNFSKHWNRKCKPHLYSKSVQSALNRGMVEYVDQKNEKLDGLDSPVRLGWYPRSCPAQLCSCDGCATKNPKPDTLSWYRPHQMCHWIAPFVLELAKLIFPHDQWEVISGNHHSVVANSTRTRVMDILLFDQLTARQSLVFAGDVPQSALERRWARSIDESAALSEAFNTCSENQFRETLHHLLRRAESKKSKLKSQFRLKNGGGLS